MNNLSLSQKQIIMGGLLGDSSFNKKRNVVAFAQCEKQYEYLKWKYDNFQLNSKIGSVYSTFNNNKYLRFYFNVSKKYMNDEFLLFIKKNLYSNEGRKKISLKYLNELTPLGLAIWWMDDGNISLTKDGSNRYGKFSTHCFNYEEHILIQKYFKEKYDINVRIKKEKNYYFIKMNTTELKKFIKLIYTYVCEIPSMIYKIDLKYINKGCIGEDFLEAYNYIESKKGI